MIRFFFTVVIISLIAILNIAPEEAIRLKKGLRIITFPRLILFNLKISIMVITFII